MGLCSSCDSSHAPTSKLILPDGSLQEYSYPVQASHVLQSHGSVFICNSDDMEFNGQLCAVADHELLQPGHLYFALPLARLHHPLRPDEMAALAVKASSALMNASAHKCGCARKSVSPVAFQGDRDVKAARRVAAAAASPTAGEWRRGRSSGHNKFTAMLKAIPE